MPGCGLPQIKLMETTKMNIIDIRNTHAESQYSGRGRAWLAMKDGHPVAIRYMADYPFAGLSDINRKRWTRSASLKLREINSERYAAWRTQCRAELAMCGDEILSGTLGSFEFCAE
jgi:hypothetical protein